MRHSVQSEPRDARDTRVQNDARDVRDARVQNDARDTHDVHSMITTF